MRATIRWVVLLGTICLLSAAVVQQASAVPAAWGEEMDALPGANWGLWDDFQNIDFKNRLQSVTVDNTPGTGAWKSPSRAGETLGSYGMAYIDPETQLPLDAIPSMAGAAPAQYTAEIRYRINTPVLWPDGPDIGPGEIDAMWFNVGGGWLAGDSGADIRMAEGYFYGGTWAPPEEWSNFRSWSGEGTQGSEPGLYFNTGAPPPFTGTPRGEWNTLRMIQDEVAQTQQVYINDVLVSEHSTAGYDRGNGFTRGLAFGYYDALQGEPDWYYPEVMYDYIRIANGVVPVGTEITAVPEPASGLMALVLFGLGLVARRRRLVP